VVGLLTTHVFCLAVHAEVPWEQMQDVLSNTLESRKHLSPFWAWVALKTGVIHSLVSMGNFSSSNDGSDIPDICFQPHPFYHGEDSSAYPKDGVSALARYLFMLSDDHTVVHNYFHKDAIGGFAERKWDDQKKHIGLDKLSRIFELVLAYKTQLTKLQEPTGLDLTQAAFGEMGKEFAVRVCNVFGQKSSKKDKDESYCTRVINEMPKAPTFYETTLLNFIQALRFAVVTELNDTKHFYPPNVVEILLLSFGVLIADDISEIYSAFPNLLTNPGVLRQFSLDAIETKRNEILRALGYPDHKVSPDEFFLHEQAYENAQGFAPFARLNRVGIYGEKKRVVDSYPNCGETSLRNFFFAMFARRDNFLHDEFKAFADRTKLNAGIADFFARFPKASQANTMAAHVAWDAIVSNLVDEKSPVPIAYKKNFRTSRYEITGGIQSMMNVIAHLFPSDTVFQLPWAITGEGRLSQYDGRLAVAKFDHLFGLLSRKGFVLTWHTGVKKKQVLSNYEAIYVEVNGELAFVWIFLEGHFAFSRAKYHAPSPWSDGKLHIPESWDWLKPQLFDAKNYEAAASPFHIFGQSHWKNPLRVLDEIRKNQWHKNPGLYLFVRKLIERSDAAKQKFFCTFDAADIKNIAPFEAYDMTGISRTECLSQALAAGSWTRYRELSRFFFAKDSADYLNTLEQAIRIGNAQLALHMLFELEHSIDSKIRTNVFFFIKDPYALTAGSKKKLDVFFGLHRRAFWLSRFDGQHVEAPPMLPPYMLMESAIAREDLPLVRLLSAQGINRNAHQRKYNFLTQAVIKRNLDLVKAIVEESDPKDLAPYLDGAFERSLLIRELRPAAYLFIHGAKFKTPKYIRDFALLLAPGQIALQSLLIHNWVTHNWLIHNSNHQRSSMQRASELLCLAAAINNLDFARFLVSHGASGKERCNNFMYPQSLNFSPIHVAISQGFEGMALYLLNDENINDASSYGTPATMALHLGNLDIFEKIIERGIDFEKKEDPDFGPLLWQFVEKYGGSFGEQHLKILSLFMKAGANIHESHPLWDGFTLKDHFRTQMKNVEGDAKQLAYLRQALNSLETTP
jgi:hypothetical protein